ncbi:MAG: 6,7-dimethyl-8-ribityllumazine synthase [Planctomycetota bacterium]
MSTAAPKNVDLPVEPGDRFAIVAARWNAAIIEPMLAACAERFAEHGANDVDVHRVPGSYELPVAAKWAAESGRYAAVVVLGCVIRGDTAHFEYVAGPCSEGCMRVQLATGVPVIFGVLTVENDEQARQRIPNGAAAADAALEMAALKRGLE